MTATAPISQALLTLPLRTTVVGSYPQPDWLVDRAMLSARLPPRVRAKEIWRIADPWLEAATDDATLLAIRDMERAGIDLITDGEIRRESYSNRFATALDGVDAARPGIIRQRFRSVGLMPHPPSALQKRRLCLSASSFTQTRASMP